MEQRKKRVQKPVGLYVLAIAVFIVLGLFQLFRYWLEYQNAEVDIPFLMIFIPLFLCVFTMASAVWLTIGDNFARIALLVFVSLNFLWWLYLVIMTISYGDFQSVGLVTTLIRPGLVLIFCWWYLNSREVVEYFKSIS